MDRRWVGVVAVVAAGCGDDALVTDPGDAGSSGPGTTGGAPVEPVSGSSTADEPPDGTSGGPEDDGGTTGTAIDATGSSDHDGSDGTGDGSTGEPMAPVVDPAFTEVAAAAGIQHVHGLLTFPPNCIIDNIGPSGPGSFCTPEREVAGAAVADFDGDGWDDLLVTRTHGRPLLYRNRGDGTFEDVAPLVGITTPVATSGSAWGDFDNDGDPDLFLGTIGATRYYLYVNDGAGGFTEEAVARGADVSSESQHVGTSVAVGDYDLDGWLDLYVAEWRTTLGMGDVPAHARLLRNRGAPQPGYFDDVTESAGVSLDGVWEQVETAAGVYGFAPGFADLDGDRWPELVVVSDFGCSRLFWNDGDGTFTDGTEDANVGKDQNGMGSTFGDFDLDGDLDWYVTSITRPNDPPANKLYRYDGNRVFHDVAVIEGVGAGGWGWGTTFFDPDNDGDLDLMSTGGWYFTAHLEEPHLLWRNEGGAFVGEIAEAAGIGDVSQGRGVLVFDYDRDGDQDVYVANNFEHGALYRNDSGNQHDHLRVRAQGTSSNRDGVGARITVHPTPAGLAQVREIGSASHYMGQSDRVAHFGLGWGDDPVTQVSVYWPRSDQTQVFLDVPRNTELVVVEP